MEVILRCVTESESPTKLRATASSALWGFLHNHQGVKALLLNNQEVFKQIEITCLEVQREIEKSKFADLHDRAHIQDHEIPFYIQIQENLSNILSILAK